MSGKQLIPFYNDALNISGLNALADDKLKETQLTTLVIGRIENSMRTGEKCWLQAILQII